MEKLLSWIDQLIITSCNMETFDLYRCPEHGVFAKHKENKEESGCVNKECNHTLEQITDPVQYAKDYVKWFKEEFQKKN